MLERYHREIMSKMHRYDAVDWHAAAVTAARSAQAPVWQRLRLGLDPWDLGVPDLTAAGSGDVLLSTLEDQAVSGVNRLLREAVIDPYLVRPGREALCRQLAEDSVPPGLLQSGTPRRLAVFQAQRAWRSAFDGLSFALGTVEWLVGVRETATAMSASPGDPANGWLAVAGVLGVPGLPDLNPAGLAIKQYVDLGKSVRAHVLHQRSRHMIPLPNLQGPLRIRIDTHTVALRDGATCFHSLDGSVTGKAFWSLSHSSGMSQYQAFSRVDVDHGDLTDGRTITNYHATATERRLESSQGMTITRGKQTSYTVRTGGTQTGESAAVAAASVQMDLARIARIDPDEEGSYNGRRVVLNWSDKGINQTQHWDHEGLVLNPDFAPVSGAPREAWLMVVMSTDRNCPRSEPQWRAYEAQLRHDLGRAVSDMVDRGQDNIEIRTVQRINSRGYAAWWRQEAVDRFTLAFLRALDDVQNRLRSRGTASECVGLLGSNGVEAGAYAIPKLRDEGRIPIKGVIAWDGRAWAGPAEELVSALEGRVTFINTKWDLPAHPWSVGFHGATKGLRDRKSGARVLYMIADGSHYGHVSGMSRDGSLRVKEYLGDGSYSVPRKDRRGALTDRLIAELLSGVAANPSGVQPLAVNETVRSVSAHPAGTELGHGQASWVSHVRRETIRTASETDALGGVLLNVSVDGSHIRKLRDSSRNSAIRDQVLRWNTTRAKGEQR